MSATTLNPPALGPPSLTGGNCGVVGGPDSLYEIIDGKKVEKPAMSTLSGVIASSLLQVIGPFCRSKNLGRAVMEVQFQFSPDARRSWRPDVAFVSYERWSREKPIPVKDPWDVVPDLAVEVQSPSNNDSITRVRTRAFFLGGVRTVWILYPETREIYIYDSPTSVRVLQLGDTLEGGAVLPGFSTPLDLLFEDVPADVADTLESQ